MIELADGLNLTTTVGFTPMDLFNSAMSLASNYYRFLILGLSVFLVPWIYDVLVAAVKGYRYSSAWNKTDAAHFGFKTSFGSEFLKEYKIKRNYEDY